MAEYAANWQFYEKASTVAEEKCEKGLEEISIEAKVTSRGKKTYSLEQKLHKHPKKDEYETKADIKASIVDLCGVRIRIQSLRDRYAVGEMIHDKFNVIGKKEHGDPSQPFCTSDPGKPQRRFCRFPPYIATHYHVHLKRQDEVQHNLGDAKGSIIEIQVRTLIHDRTATVEHPLYKLGSESNLRLASTTNLMSGVGQVYDALEEQVEMEIAEQEAKENRVFKTANDLGLFIDEWISKESAPWVKEPPVPTCKALLYLLRLEYFKSMNCQKEVRKQLQASFGEQSSRERISSLYEFANLITIAFIVDKILLTDDGKPKVPLPTYEEIDKVHVIMNTIRWLNKLFEPSLTWTWVFDASRERKMLLHGLDWLAYTGNLRLQNKEQLNATDTMHLEALWSWFETHEARQVQLTFTMSRCGINRQETDILMLQKLINGLAWLS